MNHYERYDKTMRGEMDGFERGNNKGRYFMQYQCSRCKCPMDPDDTDCMVCGHISKPKETHGKYKARL